MVDFKSVACAEKQHRAEAPPVPKGAISPPPASAVECASHARTLRTSLEPYRSGAMNLHVDFQKLLGTACFTGSMLFLGAIVVGLV